MFVRIKTTPNSKKKAVQIVENTRIGKKVSQKIIKHVGYALTEDELKDLKLLAQSIMDKTIGETNPFLFVPEEMNSLNNDSKTIQKDYPDEYYNVNLKNITEEDRIVNGIHDIYGKLWGELNLKSIFKNPARNASSVNAFKNIVLARITNPLSKLGSVDMLERNFGINLNVDSVYKMMDKIDDAAIEKLNALAYKNTLSLFGGKIDVIFFDCTTIYFECFKEDEFRRNGYSKDLKFNQPQVLLALMVTKEGLPIGYEAFSGDSYEGHTLIPSLRKLKEKYNLDKVVYVADSGMFNSPNIEELEKNGFNYIVGARIKNMPKKIKDMILDANNYKNNIASFEVNGKRLIVSYSKDRAKKDRHERIKGIERLKNKLDKSSSVKDFVSNAGYKKYLVLEKGEVFLNEEKIEEDAMWDGLKGLIVNKDFEISEEEILSQYKNLYQVEESFRITKHDLKIRPVFHYKPERVKAHLAISFASYMLVRHLEHTVRLRYTKLSPEEIKKTLVSVQSSILFDHKRKIRYCLPSKMDQSAKRIYRIMDVERSLAPYIVSIKRQD